MTDISGISLNTTVEGRVYDIILSGDRHDGKKVTVSILTEEVTNDASNVAIKISSICDGNTIKVEITDEHLTTLNGEQDDVLLQFIARSGATNLGSTTTILNKEKMVIPEIIFSRDEGNDQRATIIFDVSYGDFSPYHSDSLLSSVIVEYHTQNTNKATVIEIDDLAIADNKTTISIEIPDLSNETVYEYIVTALNSAGETNSITGKVRPVDRPNAPKFTKVDSIVDGSGNPDASNVNIIITWEDVDALSYKTDFSDASNSTLKLRIGTEIDISNNQNIFDVSNVSGLHEVFLTNIQLTPATDVHGLTIEVSDVNIIDMDASASTTGVILKAQMLPVSMTADESSLSGTISDAKTAFIDIVPTIVPIKVAVDASNGTQRFYVNGTVPSKDSTGVTLTIDNSGSRVTDLSGAAVLTDGSLNIIEAHTVVSYNDLSGNPVITATLSQVDRNGTLNVNEIYVYSATNTFNTTRFKTPTNKALFTFTGNKGANDSDLHTQLTNVNNEEFNAFDQSTDASNVVWVLYRDASLSEIVDVVNNSTNYTDLSNVDISYNFSPTDAYYLKVVKSCDLAFVGGGDYNDAQRKYDVSTNVVKSETVEDSNGPIYFMKAPTLDDITVVLDASTGLQTFTVNGKVPSQNSTDVTLFISNAYAGNYTVVSGTDVLTDGSLNIIEASREQTYTQLNDDPVIHAILSQLDRNGTINPDSTPNSDGVSDKPYDYAATATFQAYQLKIPRPPTVEFLGNVADGSELRTKIIHLNNNVDQFDVAPTDVKYELVEANGDVLTPAHDVSYTDLSMNDISYNYTTSKNYYLKATKYASLTDAVATVYSADISQNQEIETEILGPLKATTSASLVLDSIQVSVDASGEQTFYFNGTIDSLDASGAKLTMSDGSNNFIVKEVAITPSGEITEIHGSRTYAQLLANHKITATLSQPDLNGGGVFDISANVSFDAYAFKTPDAPDASGSLSKNMVGNDGKLRATYQFADLNDMNGYDLVNVTGVVNLSDVSGVFDTAVDAYLHLNVNISANQPIDLSGNYVVDNSYNMILKKGYALNSEVLTRYEEAQQDTSVTDLSAGVINSTSSNTVFYMGNPAITDVTVSGVADTVTVSVSTHGADLTSNGAVTLVLVAKDGLAGYANGDASGDMGSIVSTLGSGNVTGYNTTDLGNQDVTAVFNIEGIEDGATSVIIVDAINSHSAISLSNFPVTGEIDNLAAMGPTFNSSTN